MKRLIGLALVGLIIAVAIVAEARSSYAGAGGTSTIVLEDMRFTPNRINAKVGVPLTLELANKGTQRHDFNFESLHMAGLGGVESILEPGQSTTITLTFDQPGEHTFICTLPGHAAAGMTGAAYVTP